MGIRIQYGTLGRQRPSHSMNRVVEKHVRRWFQRQALPPAISEEATVDVLFEGPPSGAQPHLTGCRVEIRAGGLRWLSSQYGHDLQRALAQCLARMTPQIYNPVPQAV